MFAQQLNRLQRCNTISIQSQDQIDFLLRMEIPNRISQAQKNRIGSEGWCRRFEQRVKSQRNQIKQHARGYIILLEDVVSAAAGRKSSLEREVPALKGNLKRCSTSNYTTEYRPFCRYNVHIRESTLAFTPFEMLTNPFFPNYAMYRAL